MGRALFVLLALPLVALGADARAQAGAGSIGDELARAVITAPATRPLYAWLPAPELEDWIDPRTDTSTRTGVGCGLLVEAALSGDSRQNYVALNVLNAGAAPKHLARLSTTVRFESGAYRKLDDTPHVMIEPGATFRDELRFPDKEAFEGQRSLELTVRAFEEGSPDGCTIAIRFQRFTAGQDRASYLEYTTFELAFGVGVRLLESGGQAELRGGSRVSAHLDFSAFLSLSHGVSATLLFDLFGSGAVDDITEREIGPDPGVTTTGLLFGYLGRLHLTPWLTATYNPSLGPYVFMVTEESDDPTQLSTPVIALRHRLRIAARGGPFGAAVSLGHLVIPYGTLGKIELSGQTLTAMLELGIMY